MAILSPIGLKIGLHTTLDINDGQNKLEVYISKNMANKWLKISSAATFGQSLSGHNSIIFIRFGRSITLKWSARRDESNGEKN